jgi:hypothetical protein
VAVTIASDAAWRIADISSTPSNVRKTGQGTLRLAPH